MEFFKQNLENKNAYFNQLRHEHELWKNALIEMNKPFFMIPTDFSHLFLKDISGGALKLYLFLGFHAKYRSGESWYTNEQVGLFFEKDPRTVTKWFKELEDLGLIFRAQKGVMMKANTFLKPYGFFVDEEHTYFGSKIEDIESYIKNLKSKIVQGVIFNYGIQETSLIVISQTQSLHPLGLFLELNFQDIKSIRALLKKLNIPVDNFEINSSLSSAKYSSAAIYKHLILYFDEKSMWL